MPHELSPDALGVLAAVVLVVAAWWRPSWL
jgi:hypothetical protein